MTNAELAAAVAELADLMALDGADTYRVGHYRRAATAIRRFHHSVAAMIEAGADLRAVPGIGKGLAGLLADLVRRGSSTRLEEYRRRVPAGLVALMRLDGVGATRARTLRDAGVDTVEKLEAALANRELRALDGFGPAVVARLRRGLAARAALAGGSLLVRADRAAERLARSLQRCGIEVILAGDLRRRSAVATDSDMVCAASAEALWDRVGDVPGAHRTGARGDNPLLATLAGVRIRLVAAPAELIEAVGHHLTGPPAYIEALAARARERGLELTPRGIATQPRHPPPPTTEDAIYRALDLPWIPPELRQDGATVERAAAGRLPRLVTHGDIQGDLHMHTTWSDGAATLDRMAAAALDRGYRYVAVTDHSPSTGVTGGLDGRALRAQAAEIARVQEELPGIRILRGCEVDILPDGSLDIPDEYLSELDLVLIAVHSSFDMPEARMTDRIVRALENPLVDILCHPTGRKLGRRAPYAVDIEEVLRAAAALDVAVEVNANPRRLDLDHRGLGLCGRLGVSVVANSDAHSVASLENMRYAVDQARRGWLRPDQILNARTLAELLDWAGRRLR